MNKNNFIECFKNVHGDRYDYSDCIYINNKTKLKIVCKEHGEFYQTPLNHEYFKCNCPKCAKCQKIDTKIFIEMSESIHEKNYNYSMVEYKNMISKIKIFCKKHGIFEQTPQNHLKYGCKKCSFEKKRSNIQDFIERSNIVHKNLYNYTLTDYDTMHKKVKILCKEHGIFEQSPANHLSGKKCPKCSKNHKKSIDNIIIKLKKLHQDKYLYHLSNFDKTSNKIDIFCIKHGIFQQTLNNHLDGHGCPDCNDSSGEKIISNILKEKKINFVKQKKFKNCKDVRTLSFDFYLPEQNMCIEYDGVQHFKPIERWGGEKNYKIIKSHDEIKNKFCNKEKILLLRITYKDNIESKLNAAFE